MGKKINNYIEYQKRLKEFFSGIKEMPSSEEVQSFIDKYNLFIDWQIIILDVKKDISSLMLKNITGKSKSMIEGLINTKIEKMIEVLETGLLQLNQ